MQKTSKKLWTYCRSHCELGNNYWIFWFFWGFFVFSRFFWFFFGFFFLFLRCYLFIIDTETLFNCLFYYLNFSIVIKFQHVARCMYVTATHHRFLCNYVYNKYKELSTHSTNKINNNNNTNINNNNNINNNSFVDPVLNLNASLQDLRNINQLMNVYCFSCSKKLKVCKVKERFMLFLFFFLSLFSFHLCIQSTI